MEHFFIRQAMFTEDGRITDRPARFGERSKVTRQTAQGDLLLWAEQKARLEAWQNEAQEDGRLHSP